MKASSKTGKGKILIDTGIFRNNKLTIFEALVKHLKESAGMSYHEIGALLDRNERNIWTIYSRVRKKC